MGKESVSSQNFECLIFVGVLKSRDVTNSFTVLLCAMRFKITHEVQQGIHVFHRSSHLQLSFPMLITVDGMTNVKKGIALKKTTVTRSGSGQTSEFDCRSQDTLHAKDENQNFSSG
ncbi:MAG: hypothetical protein CVU60_11165 [Deltaproteobacteria bacterium HGW-Deltaproteobacteria-18]|nr:MAG: hypothetical protein CVU60_11165 [Deltaproteobacteria bacterium HGW-Deltaproteobacteria-18]